MNTNNLPRDSKGRFLPRAKAPSAEAAPTWTLLAIGLDAINPVPTLRREVLGPVARRPVREAGRAWIGNAALLAGLVAGCCMWAHRLGII